MSDPIGWAVFLIVGLIVKTFLQAVLYGALSACCILIFVGFIQNVIPPLDIWAVAAVGGILATHLLSFFKNVI